MVARTLKDTAGIRFDTGGPGPGGNGGEGREPGKSQVHYTGMFFALAAIGMLFVALTSAYVVRQGLDPAWKPVRMPAILWFNTFALITSSFTLKKARWALTRVRVSTLSGGGATAALYGWLTLTLVLGFIFLCGQLVAWRRLSLEGLYLSTSPHSSFFYLLSGLHGLHLLGGIAAILWLDLIIWRDHGFPIQRGLNWLGKLELPVLRRKVEATALYWHSMGALWVSLLLFLFAWR